MLQISWLIVLGLYTMEIKAPKNETGMVLYLNKYHIPVFFLTTKQPRDFYYLYEISEDGKLTKLGKAKSPKELEEKFDVDRKMRL